MCLVLVAVLVVSDVWSEKHINSTLKQHSHADKHIKMDNR